MKLLNLLSIFVRPSILAGAMLIAVAFVFGSTASANDYDFDALGGVTMEVPSPPALTPDRGISGLAWR